MQCDTRSAAGVIDMRPAGIGRPDNPPRSIQKLGAKHLLQLPNLLRERRLRDVQFSCRTGEAVGTGDGDQIAGVAQDHKQGLSAPLVSILDIMRGKTQIYPQKN